MILPDIQFQEGWCKKYDKYEVCAAAPKLVLRGDAGVNLDIKEDCRHQYQPESFIFIDIDIGFAKYCYCMDKDLAYPTPLVPREMQE